MAPRGWENGVCNHMKLRRLYEIFQHLACALAVEFQAFVPEVSVRVAWRGVGILQISVDSNALSMSLIVCSRGPFPTFKVEWKAQRGVRATAASVAGALPPLASPFRLCLGVRALIFSRPMCPPVLLSSPGSIPALLPAPDRCWPALPDAEE